MTAVEYFKYYRKIFCEDLLKSYPKDSIAYQATLKEKEFYDMAIKALEQEPCEDWHEIPSYEMTLEQARQAVRYLRKFVMDNHILPKLQPCDDCVSRQAVLKMAYDMSEIDGEHFTEPCMVVNVEDIQKLSSVKQEPFINKPCVSSGVCEHDKQKILDKIRAEIDHVTEIHSDGEFYIKNFDVKRIIDKYKAES